MNLADLKKPVDSTTVSALIKTQFGSSYNIDKLNFKEATELAEKTQRLIVEYKLNEGTHTTHSNASYLKLIMIHEAATKRANESIQKLQESKMNKKLVNALKIAAQGGKLSESQIANLRVSKDMQSVLRDAKTARTFMRKVIESRKAKKALNEGEIDQAQTTIAAQDIADQIQSMIEKFADIKFKELPALHDSIRNSQGVEAAEQFNDTLVASLDGLTSSLQDAKKEVNNAIGVLTGEQTAGTGDIDLDDMGPNMGDEEGDLGMDDLADEPVDDEMPIDLDLDGEDEEEVDLGRERR